MSLNRRAFLNLGGTVALATPFLAVPQLVGAQSTTPVAATVPAYSQRRLGAFTVTTLLDGTIDIGADFIAGFDQAAADTALARQHLPNFADPMAIPILGYIIDTGTQKIAVDCGTVDGFAPRVAGYHQALTQAGIDAADIDVVLLTHMHPDHLGGLSQGTTRRFPNAEIHVSAVEYDFWHGSVADAMPDQMQPFVQIARGMIAPYNDRIKTFGTDAEVIPGVQAVALPGHTPGHVGFRFNSQGQDLLIWGDLIHLTKLQFDQPDWTIAFDMDPEVTKATRAKMLDMAAKDGLLVTGSHLDFPGFGYVDRTASGYHFAPAAHDYML
ncbi:MAG: MBL fold metallo-hydrolase [Cognatishimia sp.]